MRPELPVVVEQTGEGQYLARVPGGLALLFTARPGDDDARIPASELSRWLGYPRPRKVRELIGRMIEDRRLTGVHVRPTVGRTSMPRGGERETVVDEYWLDRVQALLVATQAETPKAWEVTKVMARVFDAVLSGARPTAPAVPAPIDAATLRAVVEAAVDARIAPLRDELRVQARPVAETRAPHEELTDGTIGERRARSQIKDRINLIGALVANTRQGKAYARERKHTENYVRRLTGHQGPWHRLPEGLMGAATNAIDDEAARARRVVAALTSARQLPLPDDKGGKGPGSSG